MKCCASLVRRSTNLGCRKSFSRPTLISQDADVGQGLQVDGRGLAVTQTGLDDILDSAIRLNENEFDEL